MGGMDVAKIAGKTVQQTGKTGAGEGVAEAKSGPSQFDKELDKAREKNKVELPPEVKEVSPAEKQQMVKDLAARVKENPHASPQQLFGADLHHLKGRLNELIQKVDGVKGANGMDGVQNRLQSIGDAYAATFGQVQNMHSISDPRQLIQIQMQMHNLTQNIEMVTKVVDQTAQGLKSTLQTQV